MKEDWYCSFLAWRFGCCGAMDYGGVVDLLITIIIMYLGTSLP